MNHPIQRLADELLQGFLRDPEGRGAVRALSAYAREHEDWRRFVRFDPALYTRNLVARNEQFEMLVLCWSAGQESPIHDHAGQHCFMAVLDGEIEEIQYEVPERAGAGPLSRKGARVFGRGDVAYIHDRIALHLVRPHAGRPAVSLHLYARPIDVCRVFEAETGDVLSRQMIYHSAAS